MVPILRDFVRLKNHVERLKSRLWELQEIYDEVWRMLERMELCIKGREYDHWSDEDSPKGENVPGVRHKKK